jgi:DNA polymerase III epsilon subunit-like protein
MQSVLSKYALSPAVMRLWGYPVVIGFSKTFENDTIDTSSNSKRSSDELSSSVTEVDEEVQQAHKKSRLDVDSSINTTSQQPPVDTVGLYTGVIPTAEEAAMVLGNLPSYKVAAFDGTPYGPSAGGDDPYRQTVSQHSPNHLVVRGGSQSQPAPLSIAAVDCEMCQSASGPVVTRVTVVDADSCVVLDVLVQPSEAITEYRTQFSGITAEMLEGVTTSLEQVQVALLRLLSAETVLVGHSLENDLRCLRLAHSLCVDTAVLYPHPKGYPLRQKLKTLAADFLNLTIQRADSKKGHDSVEDSRAALQLALLKAEKGPMFGVKNTDAARVSLCSQFLEGTATLLTWQREVSAVSAVSSGATSIVSGEEGCSAQSSGNVSPSSESYLMESCIGGNAIVCPRESAADTVETACQFIAKQSSSSEKESDDKMCLVYVGIKRPIGDNVTSTAVIQSHIAALRAAVQSTSRHALFVVTGQNSTEVVTALRTKKRLCLKNPMASAVWSRENEDQLQYEASQSAMGGVVLSVV